MTEVNSNWKKLNKVVLSVNSVDLSFSSFPSLSLQCSFENIAKGRCSLIVCEKKKRRGKFSSCGNRSSFDDCENILFT